MKALPSFDKYFHYKESVQNPADDIRFFKRVYKSFFKKEPRIFREDFCGTFYIGRHWVRQCPENRAIVIDKNKEPVEYGLRHHFADLSDSEKARLTVLNKDVLEKNLPGAELITVSNFSYFIFQQRAEMLKYFKNVRKALADPGMFIVDAVGGPDCQGLSEEKTVCGNFNYYWDQNYFNPVTNESRFYIHFKRKGEKKRERVFSYKWRLWSLPELKDILKDAGFSQVHVYWEGSDKKGGGNGIFRKVKKGDPCETWVAYLVGLP